MTARPLAYVQVSSGRTLGYRAGCVRSECAPDGRQYVWVSEFFEAWFDAKMESILHNMEKHGHGAEHVIRENDEPPLNGHVNIGQHGRA